MTEPQVEVDEFAIPAGYKGPIKTLPALDPSVIGNPGDVTPSRDGLDYILKVVDSLRSNGIPSCLVQNAALIYYGVLRIRYDWALCVPTERLDDVVAILDRNLEWEPCGPCAMTNVGEINRLFPRFKLNGMVCFLTILSSQNCHLPCTPETIEHGQTGLPFPKLDAYAQSLLDTNRCAALEDLIDGMNLSEEWGQRHLDLSGYTDTAWAKWMNGKLAQIRGSYRITWSEKPKNVRDMWAKHVSADRKKRGQGWKYNEKYETRFWRRGQIDPRRRPGWF